jgi:hypothetical protein
MMDVGLADVRSVRSDPRRHSPAICAALPLPLCWGVRAGSLELS